MLHLIKYMRHERMPVSHFFHIFATEINSLEQQYE